MVLGYPPVGSLCIWVCLLNIRELSNSYCRSMTHFGIKPCEKLFPILTWKCLSVLSNVDRKYYQCIPKRGSRSDFKVEMYSWFIQRRGGTIASPFCQRTIFLYFENIISPSQHTSQCRNWVSLPLAAKISCSLTHCTFVFYAKLTTKFIGIFV